MYVGTHVTSVVCLEKYKGSLKTTVYVTILSDLDETPKQTALYPNTGSPSFDETFNFIVKNDFFSVDNASPIYNVC